MKQEFIIDEEFSKLIPPMSDDEFNALKESIVEEGCRDPLVLWDNIIRDGHNRYKICMENGIVFKRVEKNFDNRDDAKLWILKNQFGRRNLTDGWKVELRARQKDLLKEIGKKKYKATVGRPKKSLSENDNDLPKHNSQ